MPAQFAEPVVVWITGKSGRPELIELRTAPDALRAIHRDGLGGFRFESPAWQTAVDKLMKAERSGAPEAVEEAREALLALLNDLSVEPRPAPMRGGHFR
jgi:hypothetical protein